MVYPAMVRKGAGKPWTIVKSPAFDPLEALETHRMTLLERRKTVEAPLAAVDRTIEAMDNKEMLDGLSEMSVLDPPSPGYCIIRTT